MLLPNHFLRPSLSSLASLSLTFAVIVSSPFATIAQTTEDQPEAPVSPSLPENVQEDLSDPNNLRPLNQADSLLSMQGGQRLMEEASRAIDAQNYPLAAKKLQEARQVFNQLSNFYQQLAGSFSGIDNRISESLRGQALETAQMRDENTYRLALVHRAQEQHELAVPLLIQVVRSQGPTAELGKKSYGQLYEMGFVGSPYPRPRNNSQNNSSSSGS